MQRAFAVLSLMAKQVLAEASALRLAPAPMVAAMLLALAPFAFSGPALAQNPPQEKPAQDAQEKQPSEDRPQTEQQGSSDEWADIDRQLQEFRDYAQKSQQQLVALGRSIRRELNAAMTDLERGYRDMSAAAKIEWEEAKAELQKLNDAAARQLKSLSEAAENQWRDMHRTAAQTLEELARRLRSAEDEAPPPSEPPSSRPERPDAAPPNKT